MVALRGWKTSMDDQKSDERIMEIKGEIHDKKHDRVRPLRII